MLKITKHTTVQYVEYIETVEFHKFLWFFTMPYYRQLRKGYLEARWSDRKTGEYLDVETQKLIFDEQMKYLNSGK